MNEETKSKSTRSSSEVVVCSICFDDVVDGVGRGTARLECGHRFHLDCIGSAFNYKGTMQCPNCRKVERGRWLSARGSTRSIPEIRIDDWALREPLYRGPNQSRPDLPFNVHWCPFSGLARVHSAFEVLEFSPPAYHSVHRHQNMFPVNMFASSTTSETIEDPSFSYHWNGVSNPHVFPVTDLLFYNSVQHNQAPVAPVTLRATRGSYMHPVLFGHGRRLNERLQPSHTTHRHHQPINPLGIPTTIIPSTARFNGRRARPPLPVPTNYVANHNGGFFVVPTQGSSVQVSHETSPNSLFDSNAGSFIIPPRGSSLQYSLETSANSVFDHNGGFYMIQPRGLSVQNSHETPANSVSDRSGGSDSNRTGNFRNGHWS